jgi:hypothetical protein
MNGTNDSFISISYDYVNVTDSTPHVLTFGDTLSADMLAYVPKHWLGFEALPCFVHYILGVIYIFILIPGLGANATVIYLFFK